MAWWDPSFHHQMANAQRQMQNAQRQVQNAQHQAQRQLQNAQRQAERQVQNAQCQAERQVQNAQRQVQNAQIQAQRQIQIAQRQAERQVQNGQRQAQQQRQNAQRQIQNAQLQAQRQVQNSQCQAQLQGQNAQCQPQNQFQNVQRQFQQNLQAAQWNVQMAQNEIRYTTATRQVQQNVQHPQGDVRTSQTQDQQNGQRQQQDVSNAQSQRQVQQNVQRSQQKVSNATRQVQQNTLALQPPQEEVTNAQTQVQQNGQNPQPKLTKVATAYQRNSTKTNQQNVQRPLNETAQTQDQQKGQEQCPKSLPPMQSRQSHSSDNAMIQKRTVPDRQWTQICFFEENEPSPHEMTDQAGRIEAVQVGEMTGESDGTESLQAEGEQDLPTDSSQESTPHNTQQDINASLSGVGNNAVTDPNMQEGTLQVTVQKKPTHQATSGQQQGGDTEGSSAAGDSSTHGATCMGYSDDSHRKTDSATASISKMNPDLSTFLEDAEGDLTCLICYELMREPHTPKNLTCGHVCCMICLQKIMHKDHKVQCPTCRCFTYLSGFSINSLKTNWHIQNLAETYFSHSENKSGEQPNHGLCNRHSDQIRYFCDTCNKIGCGTCICENHNSTWHDVKKIHEIHELQKTEINDLLEQTFMRSEETKLLIQTLDDSKNACQQWSELEEQDIDAEMIEAIARAHQRAENKKAQLRKQTQDKIQSMKKEKQELEAKHSAIQNIIDKTLNVIESCPDYVYVAKHKKLVIAMKKFEEVEDF